MNAPMPKSRRSLNVACALDLNIWKQVAKSKPLGEPARCHLEVVRALKRLYRTVHLVPVGDDLARLLNAFKELKPDVVFNLALSACDLQPSFAGFLDFVGIPYTGSAPWASRLPLTRSGRGSCSGQRVCVSPGLLDYLLVLRISLLT
jgi:hypothetical protein